LHDDSDILGRILSVKEVNGKNYYKLYFIVDEETYSMLMDLLDLAGGEIDSVFIDAINHYYNKLLKFSKSEQKHIAKRDDVRKDLSELKKMLKRLEKRIKEAVSEVLSKAQPAVISSIGGVGGGERSRRDVSIDMPELQVVDTDTQVEEQRLSLEDALAQAIVVAIDDELKSVIENEETGNKGGEEK